MAQATSRGASSRASSRQSSNARSGRSGSDGAAATNGAGISRLKNAVVPVASVALGTAAGVVLGQLQAKRRKTVLGVPLPGTGRSDGLAKSVAEAGKQLARLADEVNTSRRKAEEVGKALR